MNKKDSLSEVGTSYHSGRVLSLRNMGMVKSETEQEGVQ